jgi:hypothetical protein
MVDLTSDYHSGPVGVSKTLTAETLSEHLQKLLYSVSIHILLSES